MLKGDIDLGQVEEAIRKEMSGPDKRFGYGSLLKTMLEIHCQSMPRDVALG